MLNQVYYYLASTFSKPANAVAGVSILALFYLALTEDPPVPLPKHVVQAQIECELEDEYRRQKLEEKENLRRRRKTGSLSPKTNKEKNKNKGDDDNNKEEGDENEINNSSSRSPSSSSSSPTKTTTTSASRSRSRVPKMRTENLFNESAAPFSEFLVPLETADADGGGDPSYYYGNGEQHQQGGNHPAFDEDEDLRDMMIQEDEGEDYDEDDFGSGPASLGATMVMNQLDLKKLQPVSKSSSSFRKNQQQQQQSASSVAIPSLTSLTGAEKQREVKKEESKEEEEEAGEKEQEQQQEQRREQCEKQREEEQKQREEEAEQEEARLKLIRKASTELIKAAHSNESNSYAAFLEGLEKLKVKHENGKKAAARASREHLQRVLVELAREETKQRNAVENDVLGAWGKFRREREEAERRLARK